MGKPRLLFLNTRMVIGGPAKVTVALAEELARRGYDVSLASGDPEPGELPDPRTESSFVSRRTLPALHRSPLPWSDLAALLEIRSCVAALKPDVLFTAGAKAGALGRIAARFVRPRPRTIHVFHGHVFRGHFGPFASRLFVLAERGLARISDDLVAICPSVADDLREFGVDRRTRCHTIYIGSDLTPFLEAGPDTGELNRELGLDPGTFIAVYPARICTVKAQDLMIDAIGVAHEQLAAKAFKLLFVGDGENREALKQRAQALGVADQVAFLGYRVDMPRIYANADLVVLASRHEGTPIALMEAIAAGRPLLSTAVGGVLDMWRAEFGRLVPPEDPEALAAALTEIVAAGPPRPMSDALRRSVVEQFSVKRFANEVEALILEGSGRR